MSHLNRLSLRRLPSVRPWMAALILCLIYLIAVFVLHGADPLTFIVLPEPPSAEHPQGTKGYDGQWVYHMAVSPIGAPPHLDVPAYRLQRILLPVLAHLLAFGQPALIPWTLLLINLAAFVAGMVVLEHLLKAAGVSPWWALIYGLSAGILMSVRLSLNEPLAYALVLAAIWSERHKRLWLAATAFALAGLAKETTLIFALGYLLWMALERRWRDALHLGLVAWAPYLIWQAVLYLWLGEIGTGPGGDLRTPFEIIPYMGFLRIYTETGNLLAFLALAALNVPTVIIPSLWGIVAALRDLWRQHWHPYSFLLLANAASVAIIPFSTFREPLGILRFAPGLTISFLLYAAHFRRRLMLRYSLLWLAPLALALISG